MIPLYVHFVLVLRSTATIVWSWYRVPGEDTLSRGGVLGPTISWQLYSRQLYILKICYMTFITRGEVEHPRSSPSVCKKRTLHGTRTTDSLVWHCMRPLLVKAGVALRRRFAARRIDDTLHYLGSITGLDFRPVYWFGVPATFSPPLRVSECRHHHQRTLACVSRRGAIHTTRNSTRKCVPLRVFGSNLSVWVSCSLN